MDMTQYEPAWVDKEGIGQSLTTGHTVLIGVLAGVSAFALISSLVFPLVGKRLRLRYASFLAVWVIVYVTTVITWAVCYDHGVVTSQEIDALHRSAVRASTDISLHYKAAQDTTSRINGHIAHGIARPFLASPLTRIQYLAQFQTFPEVLPSLGAVFLVDNNVATSVGPATVDGVVRRFPVHMGLRGGVLQDVLPGYVRCAPFEDFWQNCTIAFCGDVLRRLECASTCGVRLPHARFCMPPPGEIRTISGTLALGANSDILTVQNDTFRVANETPETQISSQFQATFAWEAHLVATQRPLFLAAQQTAGIRIGTELDVASFDAILRRFVATHMQSWLEKDDDVSMLLVTEQWVLLGSSLSAAEFMQETGRNQSDGPIDISSIVDRDSRLRLPVVALTKKYGALKVAASSASVIQEGKYSVATTPVVLNPQPPSSRMVLIVTLPRASLMEGADVQSLENLMFALGVSAAVGIVLGFTVLKTLRPIKEMEQDMKEILWGRVDPKREEDFSSIKELASLQESVAFVARVLLEKVELPVQKGRDSSHVICQEMQRPSSSDADDTDQPPQFNDLASDAKS